MDLFFGPLSLPVPSPRSQDPSPTPTFGCRLSAPAVSPRIPDLSCPSPLPCVGSLDLRRVPPDPQGGRSRGPFESVPSDQAERAMRLQALDLWLLVLLLVLLLQPVHGTPRAQDMSLGVVSSGPLAPGIIACKRKGVGRTPGSEGKRGLDSNVLKSVWGWTIGPLDCWLYLEVW